MADISKINVNSNAYNLKDSSAISGLSASGTTITYTKRDGSTGTITTQDTNTTYSAGTGLSLSSNKFSLASNASVKEAYLTWGGKNFSSGYGPIDAAMISDLGPNRLELPNGNSITIEYSRDAGKTWRDYESDEQYRKTLFSSIGCSFNIGKHDGTNKATANPGKYKLRVTLRTDLAPVYTVLNKFCIYLSTNGSQGCYCTIMARTKANFDADVDTWTTFADSIPVAGWSGYNIINTSGLITYGNTSAQYVQVRFIFGDTDTGDVGTTYNGLSVTKIMGFGGVGWSVPNNLAKNGHLYSYDASQNMFLPAGLLPNTNNTSNLGSSSYKWADVYATNFRGALIGNADTASDASKLNGQAASYYLNYNNLSNKPTIPSEVTESTVSGWGFTKNTGTVTSVAVKMNNATKGTVTSSGTIDLGTVLTSHQDISGKLNTSGGTVSGTLILSRTTDASGTANNKPALIVGGTDTQAHLEMDANEIMAKGSGTTIAALHLNNDGGAVYINNKLAAIDAASKGSATNPVYTDASGNVTACTYSLNKTVPSDAKFSDTTYSTVSKTAAGLCPALPNDTETTKFLRQDGTWANVDSHVITPCVSLTAASGWVINSQQSYKVGRLVFMNLNIRPNATVKASSWITVATNGTSRPTATTGGWGYNASSQARNPLGYLVTGGNVQIITGSSAPAYNSSDPTKSDSLMLTFTYLTS